MAHQQPPKPKIIQFRIPIPDDPNVEMAYLDLGWKVCGEELMWSHARGSPVHPGDAAHLESDSFGSKWGMPPRLSLLQLLPHELMSEGRSRLPNPAECTEPWLEVSVVVLIRFERKTSRKGKSLNSFWAADDAKVVGLAPEAPPAG